MMDRVIDIDLVVERLRLRADGIEDWLQELKSRCKIEQKHLDEGTPERVYWHYGYMVAFKDLMDLLERESKPVH